MINPGVGIMTVPTRKHLLDELVLELKNQNISPYISVDNKFKGTWYNWKRTATIIKDNEHSHALVLQDDVILCKNFWNEYIEILQQIPHKPICLFTPYKLPRGLITRKYVVSCQAISIPTNLLDNLFSWVNNNHDPKWKFDDSRLNAWSHKTKNHFIYPIPTLIDHNVDVESTLEHIMTAHMGNPWKSLDFKV